MHIRELPSKRWRWIVQHQRRRRSGTADTRPVAVLHAAQALVDMGAPHPNAVQASVEDLLTAWQLEHDDDWSPTYAADVALVCKNLPRAFLDRDISTVEPAIVATLQRTLRKQGWSPHRIQRARGCLSGAFRMGVDYGWAGSNPVSDVRAPHVDRADVMAPDESTVRGLIETAPLAIQLFLWVAAITGARRGEIVGLQWRDLDGSTLTIRRRVVQVAGGPRVVLPTTKTGRKGERRLELDATTLDLLRAHQRQQEITATQRSLPEPLFIFSHDAGVSPWRPDYVSLAYRRHRAAFAATARRNSRPLADEIARTRLHDLRHYVATSMLIDGEPLLDVAAQLGHSNPRTTAAVYAHYMPGRGGESAARRAGRLGKNQ